MIAGNAVLRSKFEKLKNLADWKLLLFLVLFLNVKLAIKIPAIVIIYILLLDFKFKFSLKNSRLPLFYLSAIAIAVFNWLISANYTNFNYNLVMLTGVGFWLLCILAMHQIKLSVENNDTETLNRTIILFFVLNAFISFLNLAVIVWETGYLNPYTYQGQHQKYFIGTGDYVKGLTFDTSTTNAILNAFGVIYFLSKRNIPMLFICMAVMLLTGSNFTNIALISVLVLIFIFKSSREQKSLITICLMFLAVFMAKISPQNDIYVTETLKYALHLNKDKKPAIQNPVMNLPVTMIPDSLLNHEQKRQKTALHYFDSLYGAAHPKPLPQPVKKIITTETGRVLIPKPNINTMPYQHIADTNDYQRELLTFIGSHKNSLPLSGRDNYVTRSPGKIVSLQQTADFLKQHPSKILTGAGIGNFSSKLAFRSSGLGFAGGFPQKYVYIYPDFLKNHLDVYLDFFSKKTDYHSLGNSPNSVYDQLLAEYGVMGLACFFIGYAGYYLKYYRQLTYGLPLLALLLAFFMIEYWFEQLSILLLFELMLLLNIKETTPKPVLKYAY